MMKAALDKSDPACSVVVLAIESDDPALHVIISELGIEQAPLVLDILPVSKPDDPER